MSFLYRDFHDEICDAGKVKGFKCEAFARISGYEHFALTRRGTGSGSQIYLSAGIHGDEPAGCLAILHLLRNLEFDEHNDWFLCPALNPQGLSNNTRENADGVDLNRDYRWPVSAEVKAHIRWLAGTPPCRLYLSFHEDWEAEGFYLYELSNCAAPSIARPILRAAGAVMPLEQKAVVDEHPLASPGYIAHPPEADDPEHWPEAIYHLSRSPHLSYTFETPSRRPMKVRVAAHVRSAEIALEAFSRQPV